MSNALSALVTCSLFIACATPTSATNLYTHSSRWLHTLNQDDASTIRRLSSNGRDPINGLSSRPGDTRYIYGVANYWDGNSFYQLARLARIDTKTGVQTDFPLFSAATLGLVQPFATGIAISSLNPDVALISGFDSGQDYDRFLWKVDVTNGTVLGPAIPSSSKFNALTYSLDGKTLFGTTYNEGLLVTVNPEDGTTTTVGDPGLSNFIEGLAFRPADGALYAIDGFYTDELVILDPVDGSLVQNVGRLLFGGPTGLAFVVPEPVSYLMMFVGVFTVGLLHPRLCRRKHCY